MKVQQPGCQTLPLKMVGSNNFGRYPKMSSEQTWNMIVSDDALVPYAGYTSVASLGQVGRGIYASDRYGYLLCVVDENVWAVNKNYASVLVGTLETQAGDVFIDENNNHQIAICDKQNIYILDYVANTFTKAEKTAGVALDFLPGYITYQDGYFISVDLNSNQWRLSAPGNGKLWDYNAHTQGLIQTKPDNAMAVMRAPGRGNLLYVFGKNVTELWYDVGAQIFPYQRSTSVNIDYGCLNQASIAAGENIVVWVASNEESGPSIVYTAGGDIKRISNDGIDFQLGSLDHPEDVYGFLFKQDGHLIYQVTFPTDNVSMAYDFNTAKFYSLSDEKMNFHIARHVAYFDTDYFFVSIVDGELYRMGSAYTTYNGAIIPRIRITNKVAYSNGLPFAGQMLNFTVEQGESEDTPRVDLSMSYDGGITFSGYDAVTLNSLGNRKSRFIYWGLGYANDLVPQFRMWSSGRFVVFDGEIEVRQ